MPTLRPRLGLSFEVAPPAAAHPLRTDIACFVGTVARRRRTGVEELPPLPVVLVRWLRSHRIERVGGVPVTQLRVSLASATRFSDGLLALASTLPPAGGTLGERDILADFLATQIGASDRKPVFNELLKACRELTPVPEATLEELRRREFA